jgi:hypothetical protein
VTDTVYLRNIAAKKFAKEIDAIYQESEKPDAVQEKIWAKI